MLRPFSRFCIMIGAIPESIIHSLSYEQQLLRLIKFLKQTVIPAIDGNTTAIQKIEEWIENVDLQTFVDKKLDEMVESGQLQEIISVYLNSKAVFGFDTIDDMINSKNLINGSYARTCGSTTYNNGYGALYKIRTITNDDVVDGVNIIAMETDDSLIAELITNTNLGTYKDEITTELSDGIIVIGDSYTDTSNQGITSWSTLFKNNIGHDSTNFFVSAYGGTGFVPNSNLSFLTLLQDLNNTITDKSKIKRIYVLGGYNDQVFTATQIWNGLQAFMTYAKSTYPNATVYVGCVGYSTGENDSGTREALYTKAITIYKRVNELGGVYMFNSEYVLHNPLFIGNDKVHPNDEGQKQLARFVESMYKGVEYNPDFLQLSAGKLGLTEYASNTYTGGSISFGKEVHNDITKYAVQGYISGSISPTGGTGKIVVSNLQTINGTDTTHRFQITANTLNQVIYARVSVGSSTLCLPVVLNYDGSAVNLLLYTLQEGITAIYIPYQEFYVPTLLS